MIWEKVYFFSWKYQKRRKFKNRSSSKQIRVLAWSVLLTVLLVFSLFSTQVMYFYLFVYFRISILFCMLIAQCFRLEFLVVSSWPKTLHAMTVKRMSSILCVQNRKRISLICEIQWIEFFFMMIWKLFFCSDAVAKTFYGIMIGKDNYADNQTRWNE